MLRLLSDENLSCSTPEMSRHDQPVLVDFWASWCPPCKMMEPMVERLEQEYAGRARVVKVNIDRSPALAEEPWLGWTG